MRARALLTSVALGIVPLAARAQQAPATDPTVNVNIGSGVFGWLFGAMFFLVMLLLGLAVVFLVFWILMLVDCFNRQWPDRSVWLAILIISFFAGLHWLAAILYYILVKRQDGTPLTAAPPPAAPPTA